MQSILSSYKKSASCAVIPVQNIQRETTTSCKSLGNPAFLVNMRIRVSRGKCCWNSGTEQVAEETLSSTWMVKKFCCLVLWGHPILAADV